MSGIHEPGEPHRYRLECETCGEPGTVRVSVEPQNAGPDLVYLTGGEPIGRVVGWRGEEPVIEFIHGVGHPGPAVTDLAPERTAGRSRGADDRSEAPEPSPSPSDAEGASQTPSPVAAPETAAAGAPGITNGAPRA